MITLQNDWNEENARMWCLRNSLEDLEGEHIGFFKEKRSALVEFSDGEKRVEDRNLYCFKRGREIYVWGFKGLVYPKGSDKRIVECENRNLCTLDDIKHFIQMEHANMLKKYLDLQIAHE